VLLDYFSDIYVIVLEFELFSAIILFKVMLVYGSRLSGRLRGCFSCARPRTRRSSPRRSAPTVLRWRPSLVGCPPLGSGCGEEGIGGFVVGEGGGREWGGGEGGGRGRVGVRAGGQGGGREGVWEGERQGGEGVGEAAR
jgi:hypothetical protein